MCRVGATITATCLLTNSTVFAGRCCQIRISMCVLALFRLAINAGEGLANVLEGCEAG